MTNIKIFENNEFGQIRTIQDESGETWFIGKDVAEILKYSKPRNAISRHVDNEDKKGAPIQGYLGGTQEMTIINESGLYSLIFSSKMEKAKEFKRWVTSEVLPTIRKHGAYMSEEVIEKTLSDPDYLIRLATNLKEERAKRMLAEAEVTRNKPKVLFADTVAASQNSCLVGELAKLISQEALRSGRADVKIGQNKLFAWLRNEGYLCKSGERKNQPRQQYIDQGLFEIKKGSYVDSNGALINTSTPKVTGKGQIYFVNKFLG